MNQADFPTMFRKTERVFWPEVATSKDNLGTGPESCKKSFEYLFQGRAPITGLVFRSAVGEWLGKQALEWTCLSLVCLFHFPSCVWPWQSSAPLRASVYSSKTWVMMITIQESHCEDLNSTVKKIPWT